jgi:hypothetical protein
MGGLCTNVDDHRGIDGNVFIIEGKTGGCTNLALPWLALYLMASVRMVVTVRD